MSREFDLQIFYAYEMGPLGSDVMKSINIKKSQAEYRKRNPRPRPADERVVSPENTQRELDK